MLPIVPLMGARSAGHEILVATTSEYRLANKDGNPIGLFTLTMTKGTVA
jgi:hypothetical protein